MIDTDTSAARAPSVDAGGSSFIEIEGLTKRFGGNTALNGLDLSISRGEFLVLLGPSGCGKTTTMRCLVGLERADEGTIVVDGDVLFDARELVDVAPNRRDMGMVFQSYALWPHKSVFGNVVFPLQMKKVKKAEARERVHEALSLVGLDGFAERGVNTLSGGQMQRVALARSLVMDPKILLLDEPLSNLDAKLRVHLRHELREIQQRVGVTTIYVTHDQDEALGLADRIVIMRDGSVAQQGTPEVLYRSPATPFVADFLGMSNQFEAVVETGADDRPVATLRGTNVRMHVCSRGRDAAGGDAGRAVVCIRPENVSIVGERASASIGAVNLLPATVLSRQYQGSRLRYHVRFVDGPDLFAECAAGSERLDAGDECTVSFAADDVLVLDRESDETVATSGDTRDAGTEGDEGEP